MFILGMLYLYLGVLRCVWVWVCGIVLVTRYNTKYFIIWWHFEACIFQASKYACSSPCTPVKMWNPFLFNPCAHVCSNCEIFSSVSAVVSLLSLTTSTFPWQHFQMNLMKPVPDLTTGIRQQQTGRTTITFQNCVWDKNHFLVVFFFSSAVFIFFFFSSFLFFFFVILFFFFFFFLKWWSALMFLDL